MAKVLVKQVSDYAEKDSLISFVESSIGLEEGIGDFLANGDPSRKIVVKPKSMKTMKEVCVENNDINLLLYVNCCSSSSLKVYLKRSKYFDPHLFGLLRLV